MNYITIDFESAYDDQYSLSKMTYEQYLRDERFRVHGLGYQIDNDEPQYVYGEANIRDKLAELFPAGNDNVMIGHNLMYDGAVAGWIYGAYAKTYYCTESMSRCLWNQESASLAAVAERCFPDDSSVRKTDELEQFKGILRELTDDEQLIMGGYCKNDIAVTFKCFAEMYRWFPELAFGVMDISLKMFIQPGFVLDRPRVETYLAHLEQERADLLAGSPVEESVLASNDQFAAWILGQGIPLEKIPSPTPKNPNNMKWPLSKNSLEFIQIQTDYPQHQAVWEARLAVKSTMERSRAARLLDHAQVSRINPHGMIALPLNMGAAHTLRFGGANKINPQNFKRGSELRKSLRAPPGQMIGVVDLSNIERRKLAWVASEHSVIQAFREERDLYSEFASAVFGRPINKTDNPTERFVGKVCELGLGYGMGAPTLRRTLAVGAMGGPRMYFSAAECETFVHMFRTRNPHTVQLWRFLQQLLVAMTMKGTHETFKCLVFETGRVRLPHGLYLNYPGLEAEENPNGGYSFTYWNGKFRTNIYGGKFTENIIQALAQALLWWQMLRIEEFLGRIGGRILLQVHDEIIMLLPEAIAEAALAEVLRIMRTKPDGWFDDDLILDAEGGVDVCYSK